MAADPTFVPKVYMDQGGDELVIASGGVATVESGGDVAVESGGTITVASGGVVDGTAATGSITVAAGEWAAADLATDAVETAKIKAAAVTEAKLQVPTDDALGAHRIARATYDFAVDGGAISAIDLGVTLPDNALVVGGFIDVITTLTSSTDAATGAISVEGADDIVVAKAISAGGDDWDAGQQAIIPKANTPESTAVKTSAAKAITFTIAVEAVTAGKFVVWLYYVVSD